MWEHHVVPYLQFIGIGVYLAGGSVFRLLSGRGLRSDIERRNDKDEDSKPW